MPPPTRPPTATARRRLRHLWLHIIEACGKHQHPDYPVLGGMGVTVCTDWRQDFPGFCDWALAHDYTDERWLIRLRLADGYSPDNCAWVNGVVYQRYLRRCRGFTAFGETQRLDSWLTDARCAVTESTLHRRLLAGWPFERALTTPARTPPPPQPFTVTTIPVGAQFERLTVIGPIERVRSPGPTPRYEYFHDCRCVCGTRTRVSARSLLRGNTRSCGCLQRETVARSSVVHGETKKTRLYRTWAEMKASCLIPSAKLYRSRGQRGILLCSAWIESYVAFRAWALATGYTDDKYLRRYHPSGDFTPENCYWSLETEAAHRRGDHHRQYGERVTAFGETKALAHWALDARCRVEVETVRQRLRRGWEPERAMTAPPYGVPQPALTAFGETKPKLAWAGDPRCVVSRRTFFDRLRQGWEVENALVTPVGDTLPVRLVTAFGETKRIHEWGHDARCVVSPVTFAGRIDHGWEPETALTTPVTRQRGARHITAFGESHTRAAWARDPRCVVSYDLLKHRLRQGWEPEVALTTPVRGSQPDKDTS